MIEMALDYDLQNGGESNEKPLTGKEKRKMKKAQKKQVPIKREVNEMIQDALDNAKQLEIDCGRVLKAEDYVMPPHMKGYVCVDGQQVANEVEKAKVNEEAKAEIQQINM